MTYSVYIPKGTPKTAQLPLVIFLHGGGDGPDSFDRAKLGQALDKEIETGRLPPMVVLNPNGEKGFWENWHDGTASYRDWVLNDLVPYAQATLPIADCPQHCYVMGVSMGGHGALSFSLHEEGMFNAMAAISAPIFSTEQMIDFADRFVARWLLQSRRTFGPTDERERIENEDVYLRWRKPEDLKGLRVFVAWGTEDRERIIVSNETFVAHLREHAIDHVAINYQGEHKWRAWKPVILELLRQMLPITSEAAVAAGPP